VGDIRKTCQHFQRDNLCRNLEPVEELKKRRRRSPAPATVIGLRKMPPPSCLRMSADTEEALP
jgi:hypothetical protein